MRWKSDHYTNVEDDFEELLREDDIGLWYDEERSIHIVIQNHGHDVEESRCD